MRIIEPNIAIVSMINSDYSTSEFMRLDSFLYSSVYKNVYQKEIKNVAELSNLIDDDYDLLHLLIDLDDDGIILDSSGNKIELSTLIKKVQNSQTKHLIFAKNNSTEGYQNGIKNIHLSINLVLTLNRNEHNFNKFFKKLFKEMSLGKTMTLAWNELIKKDEIETPSVLYLSGADNIILLSSNRKNS